MHSRVLAIAVVTLAGVAGCKASTDNFSICNHTVTTAAYLDVTSVSATVIAITSTETSSLVTANESAGQIVFMITDTTAVFIRAGSGAPQPASACDLEVRDVVEIPASSGFGDVVGPPPPEAVEQVVIRR